MATELEKIVIRVEADLATLKKGLADGERQTKTSSDKMAASLKKIGGVAAGVGKALGAMGIAAAAGLAVMAKRGLETADAIDKGAKTANISTKAFQELSFAASLAGLSQEQLSIALESFNRRSGLAKDGNETYLKTLKTLKVDLRDAGGAFKSTEQLMEESLVALSKIEDASLQAAHASVIFGDDAGKRLPLLLKDGIEGLERMRQRAHELGIVLTDDLIGKSVQAKDTLTGLQFVLENKIAVAVAENAGAIEKLATAVTEVLPKLIDATLEAAKFVGLIDDPEARVVQARKLRSQLQAAPGDNPMSDVFVKFNQLFHDIDIPDGTRAEQLAFLTDIIEQGELGAMQRRFIRDRQTPYVDAPGAGGGGADNFSENLRRSAEKFTPKKSDREDLSFETVENAFQRNTAILEMQKQLNEELLKAQGTDESRLELLAAQQAGRKQELQFMLAASDLAPELKQQLLDTLDALANVELDNLKTELQDAKDAANGLGDSLNQAFQNAVLNGENFIKVLGRMLKQVILFGQDGKGGIFGGFLNSIFGKVGDFFGDGIGGLFGFAEGGRPMPRRAAVVGERGPEIFIPDSSGTVYNNRQFGSMMRPQGQGVAQYWTIEQSIHFDTMLESVDQRIAQSTPQLIEAAKTGVQDAMQRGGTFAKTVRGF
jgi:hypothetical protein